MEPLNWFNFPLEAVHKDGEEGGFLSLCAGHMPVSSQVPFLPFSA